ncbi:MAG: ParB/RepB/Spo0J family partition protein [Acidobacteriota bacterium]|nr:ParB/RepB/Spo0J family partition protein [Acidobacteriota bacterium]
MSSGSTLPTHAVSFEVVPLSRLVESPLNPRKYFDPLKLEELAASVKHDGILEPLVVRRMKGAETLEIICGARRNRAAKMASLDAVPVAIHHFTDEQVRLIQLAENAAREDLTPIEEAEAYADLVAAGMSVGAIAEKLGKKRHHIVRRLPLAALPKKVKEALAIGRIQVGHAELIGLLPDARRQEVALSRFIYDANDSGDGRPVLASVPLAIAKRIIEEEFMTALSVAIFDPEDPALSPLGACAKCPHLTGNNPDLFGDVKGKAVCTNPKDFRLKTENHLKRLRDSGYVVLITSNEVKRAFPYGDEQVGKDFVDLEKVCPEDPKRRTYEELLGRAEKLKTVLALKNGKVRKLYPAKSLRSALVASGHAFAKERKVKAANSNGNEAARSQAQLECIGEDAVSRELAARLRVVKLTPSGWIDLLLRIAVQLNGWKLEEVLRRHGFDGTRQEFAMKRETIVKTQFEKMNDPEKRAFVVDLLAGDWITSADKGEKDLYAYLLKLAGVDYARVANRAIDEAKRKSIEAKETARPPIAAKPITAATVAN